MPLIKKKPAATPVRKKALPVPEGGIQPGHEVQDMVTGFLGIVASRTEYLNGCVRMCVAKTALSDAGEIPPDFVFDVDQLEYTGPGIRDKVKLNSKSNSAAENKPAERTGGPRPLGSARPPAIPTRTQRKL